MTFEKIRVRFAPSPTGPLHIGGVRTALYNYLFAKKMKGDFILRIEDTDQTRYVPGAEDYIKESLDWLGLALNEGPGLEGNYGPYRQSERKHLYAKYAKQLVEQGNAYYAFDTAEELAEAREKAKEKGIHTLKYDATTRMNMKNSLSLSEEETAQRLSDGTNVTIRLNIPRDETISFEDIVRGQVSFNSNELDDKVILKADGMPTYHLANIVDDHLMVISHVIRGEEWLSSTAHHVLMYSFFNWTPPSFAHLPLILKPSGKGKLSKRDGAKFGFPVFPLEWDGGEDGTYLGFKEAGFTKEALLNFLLLLGWSSGDDIEKYTLDEMIEAFDLSRIIKSGARFDYDKAKWFNQQYIIDKSTEDLLNPVKELLIKEGVTDKDDAYISSFIELMKERVELIPEFYSKASFFFSKPSEYDEKTIRKKYKSENQPHFDKMYSIIENIENFNSQEIESNIKSYISDENLKFGEILPVMRIASMGTMQGPDLFTSLELLGRKEVLERWKMFFQQLNN